jgi:hypothetical protein
MAQDISGFVPVAGHTDGFISVGFNTLSLRDAESQV